MMTGLFNHATAHYGHAHGYNHFSTYDKVKSLPMLLGKAGYRTACFGKYHLAPEKVYPFQVRSRVEAPRAMADKAAKFINADDSKPFFLLFATTEPHRPFRREGFDHFKPEDVIVPPYLPDTPECREELAQYYGSLKRPTPAWCG